MKPSESRWRSLTTAERRVLQAALRVYRGWPKDASKNDYFTDDTRKMARACAALLKLKGK